VISYRSSLHFVPVQWFLAESWPLDFGIWPNILLSPLFSKIIGPERNINLICNLSLYTHIPNIKSMSQSIAKKKWWQLFYFGITDMDDFWPSHDPWTLEFGRIFCCHHFFFAMLGYVDLIFGLWVYKYELPKNQVNISNQWKKVVTTKYLTKFQSPTAVSWPKIIQPEWISKLIYNLWLYTLIPKWVTDQVWISFQLNDFRLIYAPWTFNLGQ
jgi:hypothetical protein